MVSLVFHPVWDKVLGPLEKEVYKNVFSTIDIKEEEFYASPMRIKRKRNGGLVATVFLLNMTKEMVETEVMSIEVLDSAGNLLATENFTEKLTISSQSALPWSFVFAATSLITEDLTASTVNITLEA